MRTASLVSTVIGLFAVAGLGSGISSAQSSGSVDYSPTPPPNATFARFVDSSTEYSGPGTVFANAGSGRGQALVDIVGPSLQYPGSPDHAGFPDGIPDLIQVNSNSPALPLGAGPSNWDYPAIGALQVPSRVLRGEADGKFTDVTAAMSPESTGGYGLDYPGASPWGASTADYDGDGDSDLFYPCGGFNIDSLNSLQMNDGDGTFTPVTVPAGLGEIQSSYAATWFDYDRDGDLDLFVANASDMWLQAYLGTPDPDPTDRLYRNEGDGTFAERGEEAGVALKSNGFATASGDLDRDGWPDLVVSCYRQYNKLFYNNHDGTFSFMAPTVNTSVDIELTDLVPDPAYPGTEEFAFIPPGWDSILPVLGRFTMPVEIQDFNGDGWLDVVFTSWSRQLADDDLESAEDALFEPGERARFYLNTGDQEGDDGLGEGMFREVANEIGFAHVGGAMGLVSGDFNGDGFPDLYVGGGGPQLGAHLEEDYLYINNGESWPSNFPADPDQELSQVFYEVGALAGTYSNKSMAHGLTPLRGLDGQINLLVGNGGPAAFSAGQSNLYFENDGNDDGSTPEFTTVRLNPLYGSVPNAVGARVEMIHTGANMPGQWMLQERRAGIGFSSSSLADLEFGLGDEGVLFVNVTWPNGVRGGKLLWPFVDDRFQFVNETTLSVGIDVAYPETGGVTISGIVDEVGQTPTFGNLVLASLNPVSANQYSIGFVSLIAPFVNIVPGSPLNLSATIPVLPDGLYVLLFYDVFGIYQLGANAVWVSNALASATGPSGATVGASPMSTEWTGTWRPSPSSPSGPQEFIPVARSLSVHASQVSVSPARVPFSWTALEEFDTTLLGSATELRTVDGRLEYQALPGPPAALSLDREHLTLAIGGAAGCCDAGPTKIDDGWLVRIETSDGPLLIDEARYSRAGERISE